MEINDLTPAERRVWEAFPRGEGVDLRENPDEDASEGHAWGPERTIRAEVLSALLLSGTAAEGQVAGLNLRGFKITGKLDLKYAVIEHAIRLRGCWFERKPVIGTPGVPEDADEPPLQFNHAQIGTDVVATNLTVHGQTRINGATVGGQLNLDDARLLAPGGTALHAETLTVGTDLRAMRLEAHGRVNLGGSRIPGQLNLAYARLVNPGGVALRASSCAIGEVWLRNCDPVQGAVNLRRSSFDLLHMPPETWPEQIRIDGLNYRTLAPHLPAEQRLPALEREESGYLPYAYEQLAAAYRTVGDEAGARTVQLAKLRRHRRTRPRHARFWGVLQDATVGYGFRPLRAAGWLLALLLTGTIAYSLQPPAELKAGEAPDFNPVFYTLDLMMPIIGFGQESAFAPSGWYQWLSYLLIVTGWILATTTLAGVSRSLQRQ
ncbi:membrane-associated oxidoreductase [Streptomyces sp. ISL-86]|uniref:membrane-associated oxidoreductase n=1 Tax=Streptomyces sp. ISL-86 TaxID=2819187 RepID=UPI001BEAB645|nr:membrane-associated oxidoreductase [Streptomyces sp. ISL-86]MBT2458285.1 membrane-associated oxidoreductase [Streptomyces sp. ISL-86]